MNQLTSNLLIYSLLTVGLIGCASNNKASDPAGLTPDSTPTPGLEITAPVLEVKDGIMHITGYVRRVPDNDTPFEGRVNIDFLSPDGKLLDDLSILLSPRLIPTDPRSASLYEAYYGYVPPKGTFVRVRFVDKLAAQRVSSGGNDDTHAGFVSTAVHGAGSGRPAGLASVDRPVSTVNHRR